MKLKKIAIILLSLTSFSSLSIASSNIEHPDSIDLNTNLPLTINHKVNGKMIGNNPETGIKYGEWSSWETSSHMTNCSDWTPSTDTVDWGQPMIQTQICDAEEKRTRTVTYTYSDGTTREVTETEYKSTQVDDEQDAVGTKNVIIKTSISYSNWIDEGSPYSCTSWSPSASTIDEGVKFNQTRNCKQDQTRNAEHYDHWANGTVTHNHTDKESKTITEPQSRVETGTKKISGDWVQISKQANHACMPQEIYGTPAPTGACTIGDVTLSCDESSSYGGMYTVKWECK